MQLCSFFFLKESINYYSSDIILMCLIWESKTISTRYFRHVNWSWYIKKNTEQRRNIFTHTIYHVTIPSGECWLLLRKILLSFILSHSTRSMYQNPRKASCRSRIFLNSLVYFCHVCISVFIYVCHVSWPNEKRNRPEIWHTYSHRPYLKTSFLLFWSNHCDGR